MPVFNQSRSRIIRLIILVTFLVIIAQLFNLQVASDKYKEEAERNAILPKRIYPSRGIIFDRKNKAILNNTLMFDLMVTPSEVKGIDTAYFCQLLEIDSAEFHKRITAAIIKNKAFRPSVFEELLTPQKYARIEENMWRFSNGFFLQPRPVRTYPFNSAAHILGYVNEVDTGMINRSKGFYQSGDYAGRTGLEQYYERVLMGQRGVEFLIKDNKNRIVGKYRQGAFDTAAIPGRGLRTYIDIEVQQLAEQLMTDKVGGVVAIDPKTGGIIAMVSGPNFNPNELTGPEKSKNYQKLILDVKAPLLNRAINGTYEPGSTFKPLGALVALDEGVIFPSTGFPCFGRYTLCGHGKPACTHNTAGHAATLRLAIANSCNAYFAHAYRLSVDNPKFGGVKKGYDKWRQYLNAFGLGVKLGVDLPSEKSGNIPDTSEYNKEYRGSWNSCTNLTLGIGQDKMQSTPLQLANAMCIIANKGFYYTPHFVKKIDGELPADSVLMKNFRRRHDVASNISAESYDAVILGMRDVVRSGTARIAEIPGIEVCAKTGTAEKFMILDGQKIKLPNNSMFVCFAPKDDPRIAIAVCVENAGFGSTWAGPIARILMEKYLNDTLQELSKADVERISKTNLIPAYYKRVQYKADSSRAREWFRLTKDSSYIRKYVYEPLNKMTPKNSAPGEKRNCIKQESIAFVETQSSKRKTNMVN